MKKVCHFWASKPRLMFGKDSASIDLAAQTLKFPLITKHPNSYSSIADQRLTVEPVALHSKLKK